MEALAICAVWCRCPLAAPTGAALHSTKRGSRYWRLRSAVAVAVHSASSSGQETIPAPQSAEPPALPSKLEVGTYFIFNGLSKYLPLGTITQLCSLLDNLLMTACSMNGGFGVDNSDIVAENRSECPPKQTELSTRLVCAGL